MHDIQCFEPAVTVIKVTLGSSFYSPVISNKVVFEWKLLWESFAFPLSSYFLLGKKGFLVSISLFHFYCCGAVNFSLLGV